MGPTTAASTQKLTASRGNQNHRPMPTFGEFNSSAFADNANKSSFQGCNRHSFEASRGCNNENSRLSNVSPLRHSPFRGSQGDWNSSQSPLRESAVLSQSNYLRSKLDQDQLYMKEVDERRQLQQIDIRNREDGPPSTRLDSSQELGRRSFSN